MKLILPKTLWKIVALFSIFLGSWILIQQPALGQTSTQESTKTSMWSEPQLLSSNKQASTFPDLLVDSYGRVHVFWSSTIGNYDVVMYRVLVPNQGWSDPNDIAALPMTSGEVITRPNGMITPDGMMHLLLRYFTLYQTDAHVANGLDAGAWSQLKQVNSGTNVVYFSRIAVDSKGVWHLFYTENTPSGICTQCFYLYYRSSTDRGATWSVSKPISNPGNGVAKPQVLIDPQDNIFVVWEAGPGGDIGTVDEASQVEFVSSRDGGKSWSEPQPFIIPPKGTGTPASKKTPTPPQKTLTPLQNTAQNPYSKFITIEKDGKGNLLVVWLSIKDDLVYYSVSGNTGLTWSPAMEVPGVRGGWSIYPARTDDYSMATDSAGSVHLVMAGKTNPTAKFLSLLHLVWNGLEWSAPESIRDYQGDVPEWPRIAVGNGNQLHVVWFERDKAHILTSTFGYYTVWYANKVVDAPAIPAIFSPTLAPTPSPTATQTKILTAAPSPQPTLAPIQYAVSSSDILGIKKPAYHEADYLLMIAKTLIPTVFFLGLVILGVVVIRRR